MARLPRFATCVTSRPCSTRARRAACPTGSFSNASSAAATARTRRRSRYSCCAMGRWCCESATNVLQDPTDAEDAFQATFLVLVRRCRSIRRLESVGSWLYGVAHRVASRARLDAARRRAAERRRGLRIVAPNQHVDGGDPDGAEFGPVIQQEVQRLPEKYRAVVVLCYWQGLNQEQAAARLGCPLGTVRSRLARARNLLHRRLTRRGLAPLAGIADGCARSHLGHG